MNPKDLGHGSEDARMSKAIVNALTIALASWNEHIDIPLPDVLAFAEKFVAENGELFAAPAPVREVIPPREPGVDPFVGRRTPVGLSAEQQAAMEKGIPLCPNCQQPVNRHLPNCARATGIDAKAKTADALHPVA